MTKVEMINQLIKWYQDKEELKTMNIEEIRNLYEELYEEFESRPTNIDTNEDYEDAMDDAFSRFVDN